MSNPGRKLPNSKNLPGTRQLFIDDQQQSGKPFPGKWSDSQYMEKLDAENLLRECRKLRIQTASDVVLEPKIWIYPNWLQQGELTVLAGPPNAGKTTLVCALAAGITRGTKYSLATGLTPTRSGHVIIINREDDIATGLTSRLEAAGADLSMVHFIDCEAGYANDLPFLFSKEQDLVRLEGLAKLLDNKLDLIIVDPIYLAVDGDFNNDVKARQAYEGLTRLSKRLTCSILGIAHTVKNQHNKDSLARVAGPPALRQVPRAIMLLSKISNGPTMTGGTHVLVHAKNSEGNVDGGFEYSLKPVEISAQNGSVETTKFIVTASLTGSADDILNEADSSNPVKPLRKFDTAVKFLRDVLKGEPRLWVDIEKLAEDTGVSKGTLMNAKTYLKIITKKRHVDGRSEWRLPDSETADNQWDQSRTHSAPEFSCTTTPP